MGRTTVGKRSKKHLENIKRKGGFVKMEEIRREEKKETVTKQEAKEGTYIHRFEKPFEYEGKTYGDMTFNWSKLTGEDAMAIETEMQAAGTPLVIPSLSGRYLIGMAAKASGIAVDVLLAMPIKDYHVVRNEARSFLIRAESF